MARSITVKVATAKVIAALETKLAQIKSDYANQEANEVEYQKAYEAYRNTLKDFAITRFDKAVNIRTSFRSYYGTLNIDFDIPTTAAELPIEPQRDFVVMANHIFNETVSEIENAIRLLKMTDEETVNASTMKSIAQYL
jgi:hypothetical protein